MRPARLGAFGFVIALCLLSGCNSYSIREGVWIRTVHAQDVRTQEPVPIPDMRVEVHVEKSSDKETVEMRPLAVRKPEGWVPVRHLQPIYGVIPAGEKVLLIKKQLDREWVFNMVGHIIDDRTIDGRALHARHRIEHDVSLQGRWSMKWEGPGD